MGHFKSGYGAPVGSFGGYDEIHASVVKKKSRAPYAKAAEFHTLPTDTQKAPQSTPTPASKASLGQASQNSKDSIAFHSTSRVEQEAARNRAAINFSSKSRVQRAALENRAEITGAPHPASGIAGAHAARRASGGSRTSGMPAAPAPTPTAKPPAAAAKPAAAKPAAAKPAAPAPIGAGSAPTPGTVRHAIAAFIYKKSGGVPANVAQFGPTAGTERIQPGGRNNTVQAPRKVVRRQEAAHVAAEAAKTP